MSKLSVQSLDIPDVLLLRPRRFGDSRGWFVETFSRRDFADAGIDCEFVQDNHAYSQSRGTVRGMHFQRPPFAQAKLVRVVRGAIFDAVIDIRPSSPTYGRWCGAVLAADDAQLFIPQGFAHGYCTLEPDTEVAYKVDAYYAPQCEGGVRWDDPHVGIRWPECGEATVSEKDMRLCAFAELEADFALEAVP